MQIFKSILLATVIMSVNFTFLFSQKEGLSSITIPELNAHVSFLASDELKGRDNGDEGLLIAARYLATQARYIGLEPLDDDGDFLQHYSIVEKSYDFDRNRVTVYGPENKISESRKAFFMLSSRRASNTILEGEVVFAGYGINDEDNDYNDFESIDVEDKIVLIMNRAPTDDEGKAFKFDSEKWSSRQNLQYKLQYIASLKPKAILVVFDPKSGINSIDELEPRITRYLTRSMGLKEEGEDAESSRGRLATFMIHREVADLLLDGSGYSLEALQREIDRELKPNSFLIQDKSLNLELYIKEDEMVVPNVFGYIEGSDPVLKNEMVIYTAHYDHVGYDEEGLIYNGADDNASGSAALLEIAEAFIKEKKMPKRSVGFLWVSAEEIGLYGSEYYTDHPLWDIRQTAAAINLDMIARTKTDDDANDRSRGKLTVVGGDTVKVIGGLQSDVLMEINKKSLDEMGMQGEYRYNDRYHPERYFFRSDHFNFVKKDIPVLFYSTGTHHDYHGPDDTTESLDFQKYLKMTRFAFKAGYNTANYRDGIVVNNPYSSWE